MAGLPPALGDIVIETARPSPEKGAYLLAIRLDQALAGSFGKRAFALEAGLYLYCGSANGPGGIAARVARHLRREKKPHWHIDRLTMAAKDITVLAFPKGSECDLVARLENAGADIPLPGFGSSDCSTCRSHLLRWPTVT